MPLSDCLSCGPKVAEARLGQGVCQCSLSRLSPAGQYCTVGWAPLTFEGRCLTDDSVPVLACGIVFTQLQLPEEVAS